MTEMCIRCRTSFSAPSVRPEMSLAPESPSERTVDVVEYENYDIDTSRPLLIGGIVDAYMQIMSIDEDGTAKVEKFGHWLSRSRNDEIVLDGVRER